MKTKNITLGAVLLAAALTVYVMECQIPPIVPIPGFKIGLSNIFTLITLYLWDKKHSYIILMLRIIIGSLMFGAGVSFIYSFSGGMACFVTVCLMKCFFRESYIPAVSMAGAVVHNVGQLAAAAGVLKSLAVFAYFPVLCALGVVSGLFTGLISSACIKNKNIIRLFKGV